MNFGMVKKMYDISGMYLYEILDDYKEAETEDEKDEILNEFMKLIWSSKNKRIINKKYITIKVSDSLLKTDTGKVFDKYSSIEYTYYKSISKQQDFVSLIRQKLNNIYTNLCDGRVCIKKEYMDLIKQPKQMYFRWKNGEEYDATTLSLQIENILKEAEIVKEKYAKQKMNISWNEYKKIVVPYFKRMFENYIPLDEYEDKTVLTIDIDMWHEDNFAVAYLCKGIDGYMKNYQKEYYGLPDNSRKTYNRCKCGGMFIQNKQNNRFKCDTCSTYQPIGTKTITCIDCGMDVEVDAKDNETCRCEKHREEHLKEVRRQQNKRYYENRKKKLSRSQF